MTGGSNAEADEGAAGEEATTKILLANRTPREKQKTAYDEAKAVGKWRCDLCNLSFGQRLDST